MAVNQYMISRFFQTQSATTDSNVSSFPQIIHCMHRLHSSHPTKNKNSWRDQLAPKLVLPNYSMMVIMQSKVKRFNRESPFNIWRPQPFIIAWFASKVQKTFSSMDKNCAISLTSLSLKFLRELEPHILPPISWNCSATTACLFQSNKCIPGNCCFNNILPHHKSSQKLTWCPTCTRKGILSSKFFLTERTDFRNHNPYSRCLEPTIQYLLAYISQLPIFAIIIDCYPPTSIVIYPTELYW